MTYSEKLKHPQWQKKRLDILNRDNFKCRICGCCDQQLQIHHAHYEGKNPWETRDCFLLTLCGPCHKERGEFDKEYKEYLGRVLANPNVQEISILNMEEYEWESCIRWFRFAYDHPEFRSAYEAVTGLEPKWSNVF